MGELSKQIMAGGPPLADLNEEQAALYVDTAPALPTQQERQGAVEEICRACYFGRKYPGEIYTRCERDDDEPCPEQEQIDWIYETDEL